MTDGAGHVDQERAAAAVRELLLAVGEDPDRPGLRETPAEKAAQNGGAVNGHPAGDAAPVGDVGAPAQR